MLFDLITFASTIPDAGDITKNPLLLSGVIIIVVAIFLPCVVWFLRNLLRIVFKRNYEWLNRSLKWFTLAGFLIFILGLVLLIIPLVGGV